MPRYRVSGTITVSIFTDVVAKSKAAALAAAAGVPLPRLCHQCSGNDAVGQWSLSGELDGEPQVDDAKKKV